MPFLVLEGGDGCGKSTQAALLAERLRAAGLEVVLTFEPGATELGAAIRALLLHGDAMIDGTAEALLMAADRAQHVAEIVRPALARGAWVVSDRYLPSSLVYQGVARGLGVVEVERVNELATSGLLPDLVVVLDVDDAVAAARASGVPDRLEAAGSAFHDAVRAAYRRLAGERGWSLVDANGTPDVVAAVVWSLVEGLIPGEGSMTDAWDRVVGQEQAVTLLRNAAARPVHAYLLSGPRGSGVDAAARCFAAALVAPDDDPRAVELVLRSVHPDVVEVDPAANQIRVDDVEAIIAEASRSPVESGRKVVMVLDADRMNDAAANKLLKTLEEPPPRTVLILVTSAPERLLPTVRSRCQGVAFSTLSTATVRDALTNAGVERGRAELFAGLAGGRLDRAVAFAGRLGSVRDAFVETAATLDGSGGAVAAAADRIVAAVQGSIAELEATHKDEADAAGAEMRAAAYSDRTIAARLRTLDEQHKRALRQARTWAWLEGITVLESVYRDALSGTGVPPLNTDHAAPTVAPRDAAAALDVCRSARHALVEHNPNEGLLLERLLLHLPASGR